MKRVLLALSFACASIAASSVCASAMTAVPPGNRNAVQPPVPRDSAARTGETKTTFEAKYQKVRSFLANDRVLIGKIKATAAAYEIDPVHMIGAIVGEHTYNVDVYDRLQTYYVQALSYAGSQFRFGYGKETIQQFVARPEFEKCAKFVEDSYKLWNCREAVWEAKFSGQTIDGVSYPRDRFNKVFFQPFFAGQTFGLGQQTPLMALAHSDMVARISGYPKLSETRASEVYDAIMNPDKSLAYMAASIRRAIDDYKSIARIDISKNPGITTTLYNIGRSEQRAAALAANGGLPQENYFGWFVNDRLKDLKALLDDQPAKPVVQPKAGAQKAVAARD